VADDAGVRIRLLGGFAVTVADRPVPADAWRLRKAKTLVKWSDGGAYVNFTSDQAEDRMRASYPPDTYARLVAAKDRYDPTNLFRLNQNIRPSGGS
jgi:FAD/FMN-containing dehydrogenase